MPQFLIEATHDPAPRECLRILDAFVEAGAHYLTNALWGCMAGDHRAWIIVEANDEHQARLMAPPVIRRNVKVIPLNKFTPQHIQELHKQIEGAA